MLNCILGMVDKTKRALSILQQRNISSSTSPTTGYKTVQTNYSTVNSLGNTMTSIANAVHTQPSGGNMGRGGINSFGSTIEPAVGGAGQTGVQYGSEAGSDAFIRSKIPVSDMLAATLRSTEERVVEVRRRAEEAVLEVTFNFEE